MKKYINKIKIKIILKCIRKNNLENDILDELTPKTNTEEIKQSLSNLIKNHLNVKNVTDELNSLWNCDKKIIYDELNKFDKIELLAIKSSILAKESILNLFAKPVFIVFITLIITDNSIIKCLLGTNVYNIVYIVLVVLIFYFLIIFQFKEKIAIERIAHLINNYIDEILANR